MTLQSVTVYGDSTSMAGAAMALSERVTPCVDDALVVGGGAKRGGIRILTSVLRVVIRVIRAPARDRTDIIGGRLMD